MAETASEGATPAPVAADRAAVPPASGGSTGGAGGAGAGAASSTATNGDRVVGTASNHWTVDDTARHVDLSRPKRPPPRLATFATVPSPHVLKDAARSVTIDAARTALVVVDMQNLFCGTDGVKARRGGDVTGARGPIAPLQKLIPSLRAAGGLVVWLNWGVRPDNANLPPGVRYPFTSYTKGGLGSVVGMRDGVPNRMLAEGSYEAAVVDPLAASMEPDDIVVHKHRISGFFDTIMDSVLKSHGITTALFAGVNADQCVYHTLTDAAFLGYDCIMLEDCVATTSPKFCLEATLFNVTNCFGFVVNSAAIVEALA